jgi:hypothetical protein
LEELFDLHDGRLGLTVVLIGAYEVRLRVLVDHIVEVVVISEQGMSWVEYFMTAYVAT